MRVLEARNEITTERSFFMRPSPGVPSLPPRRRVNVRNILVSGVAKHDAPDVSRWLLIAAQAQSPRRTIRHVSVHGAAVENLADPFRAENRPCRKNVAYGSESVIAAMSGA